MLIDGVNLSASQIREASTIHGAFELGHSVEPSKVKVDLFVAGSVAVSQKGDRIGKGTGYSDREYALLKNAGGLSSKTPVVTTVHDVQIVVNIPNQEWDVPVGVIVTPTKTVRARR